MEQGESVLTQREGQELFIEIPEAVRSRMAYLEEIDRIDRCDGTPRMKRLRQIPSQTGQFIALLAAMAPAGAYIEIGTSAGYSALWLGLACLQLGRRIKTYEILPDKARMAEETFALTQFDDFIELIQGDARDYLAKEDRIAFCFLDAEKETYKDCYDYVSCASLASGRPPTLPSTLAIQDRAGGFPESTESNCALAGTRPEFRSIRITTLLISLICFLT